MTALVLHRRRGPLNRAIYSIGAETPDDVVRAVPAAQHFVLFLAWDARTAEDDVVFTFAQQLVRAGLSYVVAWGPDCERVHDLFDDADIAENPESNDGESEKVIISTWHANESLEEALWFALNAACPAAPYESTTVSTIVAVIGNREWAREVERLLK